MPEDMKYPKYLKCKNLKKDQILITIYEFYYYKKLQINKM